MSKKRHRPFIREWSMNWKTEKASGASDFQEFLFLRETAGALRKEGHNKQQGL